MGMRRWGVVDVVAGVAVIDVDVGITGSCVTLDSEEMLLINGFGVVGCAGAGVVADAGAGDAYGFDMDGTGSSLSESEKWPPVALVS
jgi:hypothetical protein